MDIRVGQCTVVVWTMDTLYKQLVEYCCGSLSSSLVNTQLVFPLDIPTERFTCSVAIGYCVQWLPQQLFTQGCSSKKASREKDLPQHHQFTSLYILAMNGVFSGVSESRGQANPPSCYELVKLTIPCALQSFIEHYQKKGLI